MRILWERPAILMGLVAMLGGMAWIASNAVAGGDGPKEGDPAPAVDLKAALPEGKTGTIKLKDYKGKKHVVLYFYPKALTGGWTAESCAFRDRIEQFAQLDTQILGISTDTLVLQSKFIEKEKLLFPLLADPDAKVTKAFDAFNPKNKLAKRVTFVINKEGNIAKIYNVSKAGDHPEEVLEFVKTKLAKK